MPSSVTPRANGSSPSGNASRRTVQSPSPDRSDERVPNQPSSMTNASTPSSAAVLASSS
jgi:hypothetical protein